MAEELRGHLVFARGATLFGVAAHWASEIVNLPALTSVPGAPSHVLGVFAHRGELLPVLDLLRLRQQPNESHPPRRAVILRGSELVVALSADRVLGVSQLEGRAPPEATHGPLAHFSGPLQAPYGAVIAVEPVGLVDLLSSP